MNRSTRRRFLRLCCLGGAVGLAGCSVTIGGDDNSTPKIKDSDNDGVIDSEDYAPRDPDVQRKEQINDTSAPTDPTTPSDTDSPTGASNAALIESFEKYQTGSLPPNWSIISGGDGGRTGIVSAAELSAPPVDGTKMLAVSWADDTGDDTKVEGPLNPTTEESYTPSKVSYLIYDEMQSSNDNWKVEFLSPNDTTVFMIFGDNRDDGFQFSTGEQDWVRIKNGYWSKGWHEVSLENITWDEKTVDIVLDGDVVEQDRSFVGSELAMFFVQARNYNNTDILIDNIRLFE